MNTGICQKSGSAAADLGAETIRSTHEQEKSWAWITDREGKVQASNAVVRGALGRTPVCRDTLGVILAEEWARILNDALLHGAGQGILRIALGSDEVTELDTTAQRSDTGPDSVLVAWSARPVTVGGDSKSGTEAELLLETIFNHLPDLIYFKDRQSRFVRWSHSFKSLFKLPEGESLAGRTDFDFFAATHAGEAFEDERRIMETGEPVVGKLEMEDHSDGRVTWSLTTKVPWHDHHGSLLGTFGVSKDVTALKEAEARLEAAHKNLVNASRMAGMAEVACDVLHNAGNVLNSVNVSCSVVRDRLRDSRISSLSKLARLFRSKEDNLGEFLSSDPQGQKVPEYLDGLAAHLEEERRFLTAELDRLSGSVDHIKEIISMQQNYARMAGVVEEVELSELVDDSIRINAAALARHRVEIRKELTDAPTLVTIKHKVLQILVNLIRNAKYAVSEAEITDGWVKVCTACANPQTVVISVYDNGVGIRPEHLHRIFNHGFTTRKDGHGYGLHSAALTARELGGSLQAASDGPGQGARFTLRLPLKYQPPRP